MKVLVVNSGSSSLKFTLFDMDDQSVLCKGQVERIGLTDPKLTYKRADGLVKEEILTIQKHPEALRAVCEKLVDSELGVLKSLKEVDAIVTRKQKELMTI